MSQQVSEGKGLSQSSYICKNIPVKLIKNRYYYIFVNCTEAVQLYRSVQLYMFSTTVQRQYKCKDAVQLYRGSTTVQRQYNCTEAAQLYRDSTTVQRQYKVSPVNFSQIQCVSLSCVPYQKSNCKHRQLISCLWFVTHLIFYWYMCSRKEVVSFLPSPSPPWAFFSTGRGFFSVDCHWLTIFCRPLTPIGRAAEGNQLNGLLVWP